MVVRVGWMAFRVEVGGEVVRVPLSRDDLAVGHELAHTMLLGVQGPLVARDVGGVYDVDRGLFVGNDGGGSCRGEPDCRLELAEPQDLLTGTAGVRPMHSEEHGSSAAVSCWWHLDRKGALMRPTVRWTAAKLVPSGWLAREESTRS